MSEKKIYGKASQSWTEYIIVNYRWVLVIFFLLPISFLYDIYSYTRSWIIFKFNSAPLKHSKKVQDVQQQVRTWNDGPKNSPMCTSRPGWQTISFRNPLYKKIYSKISINMLDILEVDTKRQIVRCEPLVTMGQLSKVLIDLGWTLPVLPEMDDLTVGGMVMGTGVEASSHKYGLFQDICVSYELVLADGEVTTCTKDENPDLFYTIPWSHGTLGFLTAVEIKIIPALRFVKLQYKPCQSRKKFEDTFREETLKRDGNNFVEGLLIKENGGVVMTGNMTSSAEPGKVNELGKWYKPWFFKHVESILSTNDVLEEYIPLRDFFHRHTRSIFWEMQDIVPFGNHPIFRYTLGWLTPPKVSFLKLTQTEAIKKLYEENHFIQDFLVPLDNISEFVEFTHKEVKIYPLWVCPFKLYPNPGLLRNKQQKEVIFIDLGIYGTPNGSSFDPVKTTRKFEEFVRKLGGFQMLHADTYMTEGEFRKMFDHELYDKMREKLNCKKAFPEVYNKVCRKARG